MFTSYCSGRDNYAINPKVVVRTSHHLAGGVLTYLDKMLEKFCELESFPTPNFSALLSTDEARCENHFSSTFSRDGTGRYVVRLPFKVESISFPDSFNIARNLFHILENRLDKNPQLYDKYKEFMQAFLDLGHMSLVKLCCFCIKIRKSPRVFHPTSWGIPER